MKSVVYDVRFVSDGTSALAPEEYVFTVWDGGISDDSHRIKSPSSPAQTGTWYNKNHEASRLYLCMLLFVIAFSGICIASISQWQHSVHINALLSQSSIQTNYVQSGDTIWSIAEKHPVAGVSTSELAHYIAHINGTSSEDLHPGDKLLIPSNQALKLGNGFQVRDIVRLCATAF